MYACCVYTRHDEADVFIKVNQKPNPKLPTTQFIIIYTTANTEWVFFSFFFIEENFYSLNSLCQAFIFLKKNLLVVKICYCM